mmetsp:Transcript_23302/g.63169  ORF Transcript_23302/g.63169 Transcript_23302/m.63169 type:complete len:118 (-) Transcript_23302:162-515(-)
MAACGDNYPQAAVAASVMHISYRWIRSARVAATSKLHELVSEVAKRASDKLNEFTPSMDFIKAAESRVTEYIRHDIGMIAVRGIASMLLDAATKKQPHTRPASPDTQPMSQAEPPMI